MQHTGLAGELGYNDVPNAPAWGELSPMQRDRFREWIKNPIDWMRGGDPGGDPTAGWAQETPGRLLAHLVKAAPWDAWFEGLPESTNVQDLRTPHERALDNELMYKRNRNVQHPLVQFPPVSVFPEGDPRNIDPWTLKVKR
jgi:hypothetical protein